MFCISFFHVSLQQARITTSAHVKHDKELPEKKQLIRLILILLTDCYFLTRTKSWIHSLFAPGPIHSRERIGQ